MKKRTVSIFLILILVLISCLAIALPVTADNHPKPIAWATWGGDVYNPPYALHDNISLLVKEWSDGSITGHFTQKFGGDGVRRSYSFYDVEFTDGPIKTVDILTDVYYHPEVPELKHFLWWRLKDAGEPGVSDTVEVKIWVAFIGGDPSDLSNYIPGQWVAPFDPLDPFNDEQEPGEIGIPAWYPWMPDPTGEMAITNGNIQIHIKE